MAGLRAGGEFLGLTARMHTVVTHALQFMPELPEAETIARGLRHPLPGHRISGVEVVHSDVLAHPSDDFAGALTGARFLNVKRRGKNLVLGLEDRRRLVVNLGMSGRLLFRPADDPSPPPSHPAVRFVLGESGARLIYHDVRRFGRLEIFESSAYRNWSDSLGPEPLGSGFTLERLIDGLGGSRTPLRSWLLDQRRVAGVGNIYANEAAFVARIHPATPVHSISRESARRLHRGIRSVLREAIDARGTTLRDYRTSQGREGEYGGRLRVYGRAGKPCPRCGKPIERTVFTNRAAFHCPRCQPEP